MMKLFCSWIFFIISTAPTAEDNRVHSLIKFQDQTRQTLKWRLPEPTLCFFRIMSLLKQQSAFFQLVLSKNINYWQIFVWELAYFSLHCTRSWIPASYSEYPTNTHSKDDIQGMAPYSKEDYKEPPYIYLHKSSVLQFFVRNVNKLSVAQVEFCLYLPQRLQYIYFVNSDFAGSCNDIPWPALS